jgi:hypothetical protein
VPLFTPFQLHQHRPPATTSTTHNRLPPPQTALSSFALLHSIPRCSLISVFLAPCSSPDPYWGPLSTYFALRPRAIYKDTRHVAYQHLCRYLYHGDTVFTCHEITSYPALLAASYRGTTRLSCLRPVIPGGTHISVFSTTRHTTRSSHWHQLPHKTISLHVSNLFCCMCTSIVTDREGVRLVMTSDALEQLPRRRHVLSECQSWRG